MVFEFNYHLSWFLSADMDSHVTIPGINSMIFECNCESPTESIDNGFEGQIVFFTVLLVVSNDSYPPCRAPLKVGDGRDVHGVWWVYHYLSCREVPCCWSERTAIGKTKTMQSFLCDWRIIYQLNAGQGGVSCWYINWYKKVDAGQYQVDDAKTMNAFKKYCAPVFCYWYL